MSPAFPRARVPLPKRGSRCQKSSGRRLVYGVKDRDRVVCERRTLCLQTVWLPASSLTCNNTVEVRVGSRMVAIMLTGAVVPGVTAGTTTVTFLAKDTLMAAK